MAEEVCRRIMDLIDTAVKYYDNDRVKAKKALEEAVEPEEIDLHLRHVEEDESSSYALNALKREIKERGICP